MMDVLQIVKVIQLALKIQYIHELVLASSWKPEHMGDGARGVKLLAEQLSSEIKVSGKGFALAERGRQFQVYV